MAEAYLRVFPFFSLHSSLPSFLHYQCEKSGRNCAAWCSYLALRHTRLNYVWSHPKKHAHTRDTFSISPNPPSLVGQCFYSTHTYSVILFDHGKKSYCVKTGLHCRFDYIEASVCYRSHHCGSLLGEHPVVTDIFSQPGVKHGKEELGGGL